MGLKETGTNQNFNVNMQHLGKYSVQLCVCTYSQTMCMVQECIKIKGKL